VYGKSFTSIYMNIKRKHIHKIEAEGLARKY
jgi:hypothetical protein